MRTLRRAALFVVLPLVVITAAVFGWYRLSDAGRGGRYQHKLADYCQGLVPEAESAVFTDRNEKALWYDEHHSLAQRWETCDVGDLRLTIGDVSDTLINTGNPNGFFALLRDGLDGGTDELPMAIGGGWEGYTDLSNTGVVLGCTNRQASVVVSAVSRSLTQAQARQAARLVTATAVRAARRYDCDATYGGPIPPVPQPAKEMPPKTIGGTCAGIPVKMVVDTGEVNWIKETAGSGTSPVEGCILGRTVAFSSAAYHFQADYGPYALGLRTAADGTGGSGIYRTGVDAGRSRGHAWATARCPGHAPRAIFSVSATEFAAPTARFLTASLRAFAEHAVQRHSCTDLRLPR
ncbi:hypothetical protein ACFYTC_46685 [Actinomadura nitritigenes]|uniref:hypothetical protein n=1 Tax=Actinomadura nitritigenes TaxID=134602 RepID=UPI0036BF4B10